MEKAITNAIQCIGIRGIGGIIVAMTNGFKRGVFSNEAGLGSSVMVHSNSNIKELIDNWYQENLNSFSNFIEDTIYCNDRSIIDLGGWNPNGGNTNGYPLKFKNNIQIIKH